MLNLPGPPTPQPEPQKASPRARVGRIGIEAAVLKAKAVVEREEKVESLVPVKAAPLALGLSPLEDAALRAGRATLERAGSLERPYGPSA